MCNIGRSMTSKVIEGHKSSSNFSVNPTLPLMDGLTRIYEPTLPLMISPHYVQFSAPFTLKERGTRRFPLLRFDLIFLKIKHDHMRPVLCYEEVLRFFKTSQSFYKIISSLIHKKFVTAIFDLFFLTTSFLI